MKLLNKQKNQRGESTLSILLLIVAAVLVGTFAFKAVPAYMQNRTIVGILEELQQDPTMKGKSTSQMKELFFKRLRTNSIYEFDKRNFTVKEETRHTVLRVTYSVQKKYMLNIDLLLHFDDSVEIPPN
ncbi:DUF4845 domain-containing protein [Solemya velum gill symbiont]|uniref:DUF4845 domain-containing protein n=1 Tax=Solemya velum gill symbiont TaxID=2340 RepID=UPI000996936A|nr:DUF4845 domain-containing protein [Solemya velum gill symbiont]OOY62308.1 hypothetical protein BOW04_06815 [Solemya velum gill symbiont]OOY72540.1 hypothetical protein BOW08_05700 [Solemya velum gill symbiont]